MGVDSQLGDKHVWPECFKKWHDSLPKSPEVHVVRRVGIQGDVYRVSSADPGASLLHESGARKQERARLVERDRQNAVGRVEGVLNSVTMMAVYVDVGDPHTLLKEPVDSDHGVVEHAEAVSMVGHCVMQAT